MRQSCLSAMGILLGGVLCLAQTNAPSGAQPAEPKTSSSSQSGDAAAKIRAALEEHIKGKAKGIEILTDTQGIDFGPYLNTKGVTEKGTGDRSSWHPPVQILTDTMGVDFNPYLNRIFPKVKQLWYNLIPESAENKRGKVVLEFKILKDGSVAGLRVVQSSGDAKLDRPAYGSITGSNPFPPLPVEFNGPHLGLRISYYYNLEVERIAEATARAGEKPGLSISPVESTVAAGSTVQFRAVENYKDAAVTWSIIACDNTCGTISSAGLYTAPAKIPPSNVTIRATVVLIPNDTAETTVKVVEPKP
jgi:TonB family protein